MNESQQVASLAGIPMDQVKEFIRQYIELAMVSNTITLWISGVIFVLCLWGFIAQAPTRYRSGQESFAKFCVYVGLISFIFLANASWDRYKMKNYPIPYIIQDLRSSNS